MQTTQLDMQAIAKRYFANPTEANFSAYYVAFKPIAVAAGRKQTRDIDMIEIAISDFFMKMRSKALGESTNPFVFDDSKSHKSFVYLSIQRSVVTKIKVNAKNVYINDFSHGGESDNASSSTFEGIIMYNVGEYDEVTDDNVETKCVHNCPEMQVDVIRDIVESMGLDTPTKMALLGEGGFTQEELAEIYPDQVSSMKALKTRVHRAKLKMAEKFAYKYNMSVLRDGGSSADMIDTNRKDAAVSEVIVFNPL